MVSVILASNEECKARAIESGFREMTVLVKYDAIQSTEENRRRLETDMRKLHPYRFLAADYWGASVE